MKQKLFIQEGDNLVRNLKCCLPENRPAAATDRQTRKSKCSIWRQQFPWEKIEKIEKINFSFHKFLKQNSQIKIVSGFNDPIVFF